MIRYEHELRIHSKHGQLQVYLSREPALLKEADRPLVILSHGLTNDHSDAPLFAQLHATLTDRGFDVVAFDYFGSGRSDGEFRDKTLSILRGNLAAIIDHVAAHYGAGRVRRVGLFGRSIGGTLCGFFATHPSVYATVLASPPLDLVAALTEVLYSEPIGGRVRLPERIRPSGQLKGEYCLTPAFFAELPSLTADLSTALDSAPGVLLVEGGCDYKLPAGQMDAFRNRLGTRSRYEYIPGLDHNYEGFEQHVVDLSVEWYSSLLRR